MRTEVDAITAREFLAPLAFGRLDAELDVSVEDKREFLFVMMAELQEAVGHRLDTPQHRLHVPAHEEVSERPKAMRQRQAAGGRHAHAATSAAVAVRRVHHP